MTVFPKNRRTPILLLLFFTMGATRLFGLLRSALLASLWGTGENAAAFEAAYRLASSLYDLSFGAVLAAMLIPALAERLKQGTLSRFVFSLLPTFVALSLLVYLPFFLFPEAILSLVGSSLSEQALLLAAPSLRLLSLGKLVMGWASLFVGVQQIQKKPLLPALLYALSSLGTLLFTALARNTPNAVTLSYTLLWADLAVALILFFQTFKKHPWPKLGQIRPYRPAVPIPFLRRLLSVMAFSAFLPLAEAMLSLYAARRGSDTLLSANAYAIKPILLSGALFASLLHATLYPRLSLEKTDRLRQAKTYVGLLLLVSSASALLLFLVSEPLLSLLYRHGAFSQDSFDLTLSLLRRYTPSLPLLAAIPFLCDLAYLTHKSTALALVGFFALLLEGLLLFTTSSALALTALPLSFFVALLLYLLISAFLLFFTRKEQDIPLSLVLVLSDANVGGAGRQLLNYLAHCRREEFAVTVVLPEQAALTPAVRALGYPVFEGGKATSFSLSTLLYHIRLLHRLHPQIVNANASFSARLAAFLTRVPIRVYTRHCVFAPHPMFRRRLPRLGMRLLTALLSSGAIAVADKAAENLSAMGVSPHRITVIPNGVDPIRTDREAGARVRQRYHLENAVVAVICGRLEPDKGLDSLLEAAALLRDSEPAIGFLIVGTGRQEKELRARAEALSLSQSVHFCGFATDVTPYLNAADIYLNCSVGTEATSLAIAEAMSLSLPVIATDYGGNPAMVEEGKNGILIPPKNPRALADALLILTDEALRRRFGQHSHTLYTARFDAAVMAKRNEALYKSLYFQKRKKDPKTYEVSPFER